jgi:hypothetical protein
MSEPNRRGIQFVAEETPPRSCRSALGTYGSSLAKDAAAQDYDLNSPAFRSAHPFRLVPVLALAILWPVPRTVWLGYGASLMSSPRRLARKPSP